MKKEYRDLVLDQERALYAIRDAQVAHCRFAGPVDGESALKECRNLTVEDCDFELRYPFWHLEGGTLRHCRMTEACRAALWYDRELTIEDSSLQGIKALRECRGIHLRNDEICSPEFGWYCQGLTVDSSRIESEYLFLQSRDMQIDHLRMKGKYSFQYTQDVTIRNSELDTKDAFWHSRNVTVVDSLVKGEYLGWYSQGLKLIRCTITGTQPLCYAKDLVLEDCRMIGCDLSFENSSVQATVLDSIDSVKNPESGSICADAIGEILLDEYRIPGQECRITERKP